MTYTYKTKDVCSTQIQFRLEGDRVHDVRFTGGCNGNLKAIGILVEGMSVDEIESKLRGNSCGGRPTSCADQLAQAVRAAYRNQQEEA
ncbi:MAG: TIGR03905 family TSCPD domain-containing protein [Oscillospiraceae bacterium]|nr:TIGR03905 family TSCPD domain-containing protein [Oscillospiraceae bacterium]